MRSKNNILRVEKKFSRQQKIADFDFTVSHYQQNLRMAKHTHESPYISLVLRGAYQEKIGKHVSERIANSVIFHTAQEGHAVRFHNDQTQILQIEFSSGWFGKNKDFKSIFESPCEFNNGTVNWIAARLFMEYKRQDQFSSLAIQGLMLEMLAEAGRYKTRQNSENKTPKWLNRVEEILYEQFESKNSLESIAQEVGVHPVYLSREFRKRKGYTIGEFVRRRRIEVSCRKISDSKKELCDIAYEVGFYDQSHFTNTFKRITGITPAEYRAAFQ